MQMEISAKDDGRFLVEMRPFSCIYWADVPTLPNQVMGDEKRTFEVLLHMGGHLINVSIRKGSVIFEVVLDIGADGGNGSLGNKKTMDDS
ncbi:hypothetical protein R3W88_029040 [Solanum pinnatisectum]|uniref:Uncharacterized protein n=1 Tax=Solanum pinnatisectum TaxID=50273 RepID=A0AAV9K467_9SOLN|nr:hypothetical protein R3W88_029040 [Solanum pinnatisectum]